MQKTFFLFLMIGAIHTNAQQTLGKLTVEKIMRDPKWMGSSPTAPQWSADGKELFFNWNPDHAPADSLYYISPKNNIPAKATALQKQLLLPDNNIVYNNQRTAYTYAKDGDIFFSEIKTGRTSRIVSSTDIEYNPQFSFNGSKLVYTRSQNLYAWDIGNGETIQLTRIQAGSSNKTTKEKTDTDNQQEKWLKQDQLQTFEILKERKEKK